MRVSFPEEMSPCSDGLTGSLAGKLTLGTCDRRALAVTATGFLFQSWKEGSAGGGSQGQAGKLNRGLPDTLVT